MGNKFKIVLAVPEYFKDSISVMKELVNETTFEVTTNGLKTVVMDPANVSMIIYKLEPSACVEFEVMEPYKFALNVMSLYKILKKCKTNDMLEIQDDGTSILLRLKGSIKRDYRLPIIESEEKEQKVPELDFKEIIVMDSAQFKQVIEAHVEISDSILFKGSKHYFLTSSCGDLNKLNIDIEANDETHVQKSEDSVCKYSLDYLDKFVPAAKYADRVLIEFGKDYPLSLTYQQTDKVSLRIVLAPKVDSE